MAKPYRQIYIENLDEIRSNVRKLITPEMMTAESIIYDSKLHDRIIAMPEIIAAIEQFGGMSQVWRVAFNIVKPNTTTSTHCDYSDFNYSFNIPILNFIDTYIRIYTPDPKMTARSYTNIFGKNVLYWDVDESRCQLINEIETIYPHIVDIRFPHAVINEQPNVRINMLIRLKPLVLDCMN